MRRKAELSTSTHKPEQTRDRHGFRGTPPPTNFSLASLADDALLTEFEVAALLRVSSNTLGGWRRQESHPLKWLALPNGFVRYTAGHIREFLTRPPRGTAKPAETFTATTKIHTEDAAPERRRASRRPRAAEAAATEAT
jgi:hypothetical protein